MHYYKFNIGDYASHTLHLDLIEDLAYRRMLDWVYLHESPLPDSPEQIGRLIRMRTHSECIAVVLREFFTLTDHGWMQEKAFLEIEAYKEKSTKAKASAAARWSKKPIDTDANALPADSERNANHKPLTTNHKTLNTKQETEKEVVCNQANVDFTECLLHLKTVTGRGFKVSPDLTARLKDYSVAEVKQVIEYKAQEWMTNDMQKYLRPATLFNRAKFEGYLNDAQQMVPTEKQTISAPTRQDTSINNLINMFSQEGGFENGQPKQLPTNNA